MIIRTFMSERAAAVDATAVPKLSQREQRRLAMTKHPEKKPQEVKVEEEVKEDIPVAEVREEKKEPAVSVQIIGEHDSAIAEPGTARIRSKALEEIEQGFKKDPEKVPRKKYKVISLKES